jgi:hypothetical protein
MFSSKKPAEAWRQHPLEKTAASGKNLMRPLVLCIHAEREIDHNEAM